MMAFDTASPNRHLRHHESLAKHTSWRVGGPARTYFEPHSVQDLVEFLPSLPPNEPLLWLGLGSNLLVRDGGFNGTVISYAGHLDHLQIEADITEAQIGVYCSKLAKQLAKAGMVGGAFWAGIPGTVGGALAMNAGAHGAETWQFVVSATTINRRGELKQKSADAFGVRYRQVQCPEEEWFIAAQFRFDQGDSAEQQAAIKALLKARNASQPTHQPTAGSVFRNPPGDFAGRLIETAGLKGLRVGGASVSEKHANFIVTDANATAADVEQLMHALIEAVLEKHGVALVPEVHIVGDAS